LALRRSGVGVHLCPFLSLVRSPHDKRRNTFGRAATFAADSRPRRTRIRSHAHKGPAASDQALSRGLGMVVRSQHLLVSRRLLWPPWLSQMVTDPAVHGVEGGSDRRCLYAHGLGAAGLGLRDPAAAGTFVGICGDHGIRIRLHASPPGHIFRANGVATIASYQKENGL